ncbi:MAG: hypothetical protein ABW221_07620 [Vicinamibacteria bacterium]
MMVGPALVAGAAEGRRPNAKQGTVKVLSGQALGGPNQVTITYDTGTNIGFYPDAVGGNVNRVIGNRFNSQLGQPLLMTGMLSMLTVFPANNGTQSVSIGGTPNTMGTATVIDYIAANLMASTFNQVTFPAVTVPADFVGVFIGTFGASQPAGLLGMSDMAVNGQGYHAVDGFYLGGNQTMLAPIANRNAMIRASGDPLPVELMDFKIQ